jgi:hypothetical protein
MFIAEIVELVVVPEMFAWVSLDWHFEVQDARHYSTMEGEHAVQDLLDTVGFVRWLFFSDCEDGFYGFQMPEELFCWSVRKSRDGRELLASVPIP